MGKKVFHLESSKTENTVGIVHSMMITRSDLEDEACPIDDLTEELSMGMAFLGDIALHLNGAFRGYDHLRKEKLKYEAYSC